MGVRFQSVYISAVVQLRMNHKKCLLPRVIHSHAVTLLRKRKQQELFGIMADLFLWTHLT